MRGSIVAALRSTFEVVEGADYEAAYKLLQEAGLDVLLLAVPMESGGLRECTELLSRLAIGDIDTLVIVLSTDQTKATALKVIDAGCHDYFIQPIDTDVLRLLLERSIEKLHIQRENRILREQIPRRSRAFVSVNCAALPEGLMEAELFGYERGAFTGAVATKEGRIEL